jgi:hypothetical protein
MKKAAEVIEPNSGRKQEVITTQTGIKVSIILGKNIALHRYPIWPSI